MLITHLSNNNELIAQDVQYLLLLLLPLLRRQARRQIGEEDRG